MQKTAARQLVAVVQQAWILALRYDAVIANPPYMGNKGMNKALKDYAKQAYPNSKSDLFAIFMEHAFSLLAAQGYNAQINMQSWMFLSSYEKFREWLLKQTTIITMAHLGGRAFDSISGEVVSATAFVMEKAVNPGYVGSYLRLVEGKSEAEKKVSLREAIQNRECGWLYETKPDDFNNIPGCPVAYWLPVDTVKVFKQSNLVGSISSPRQGMATTNDAKFLRLWPEVSASNIELFSKNSEQAYESGKKWFPFLKGGDFKKWYGNNQYVVNFINNGEEVCTYIDNTPGARVKSNGRVINRGFYFQKALTWTLISGKSTAFRFCPEGFILGHKGPAIYGEDKLLNNLGVYLNSKVAPYYLEALSPTIGLEVGQVSKLPFTPVESDSTRLVGIAKKDWDSHEISWDFSFHELLAKRDKGRLSSVFEETKKNWIELTYEARSLEEKNNEKLIPAYGLEGVLSPEVSLDEITLSWNPYYQYGGNRSKKELFLLLKSDTIVELMSYAIGCMMGRYSVDNPGLILASQGETVRDYLDQVPEPCFSPDDNAIIPLTDQEWFPDDATNRFRDFVRIVWGYEYLQENLDFVAESLCLYAIKPKKVEAALDTIRRYLSTQFYKDHLSTYKKRPIYWLFSSGKQKAFECLVYLHRYNESTLAEMRTDYVIPLTEKLAGYVEKLEQDKETSASAAEAKRIEKELSKLYKQQAELNAFDEKLRHYADQRISLDLDDGVKVNYGKFGDLLADVKAVTGN